MLLATQYYRPPFPASRWWEEDLDGIKAAGLSAIQLWACWGWIEPSPGAYRFDDYDRLIEGARERGLGVVISSVAEIMPFWVPRVFPGTSLIDHLRRPVISTERQECNVGLTPGGCTDHAELREAMTDFMRTLAARYAEAENLVGWDCWNELRWMVGADGYVCYCPETLAAYRRYLRVEYGDLDGLNRAWRRRYESWEDIDPPKAPGGQGRPIPLYTDTLAWQRFLVWRAADTCRWRYEALREGDPEHPILAHCAAPTAMPGSRGYELPTTRGNDWVNADQLDGYGSSHFPNWGGGEFETEDIGVRIACVRAAAGDKPHWLSELQGGQSNIGLVYGPPVSGAQQQSWVWNGYSRGAKAVIFWCWRDEIFAAESSGFGIIGDDGRADDRLAHMRRTAQVLKEHGSLLDDYDPDTGTVGLLFTPETPMIDWSINGAATQMSYAFLHYARGLERLGIPYEVLEPNHLEKLDDLALVIMPEPVHIDRELEHRLLDYVTVGGKVFAEAWAGAWDENGFFNYNGKQRSFAHSLGLREIRRKLPSSATGWSDAWEVAVPTRWAVTPWTYERGTVLATDADDQPLLVKVPYGAGHAYMLGTWAAHGPEASPDFFPFLDALCHDAHALPDVHVQAGDGQRVIWRKGTSDGRPVLFLINLDPTAACQATVRVPASEWPTETWCDLYANRDVTPESLEDALTLELALEPGGVAILVG